jgi:hypothetical protein
MKKIRSSTLTAKSPIVSKSNLKFDSILIFLIKVGTSHKISSQLRGTLNDGHNYIINND